jgi:polyhydroxybutyrate depolymerase
MAARLLRNKPEKRTMNVLLRSLTKLLAGWACWASVATAGNFERTVQVGAHNREYRLHVPDKLPDRPLPLVLVFHGGGGNPKQIARETGFDALADRDGFLVAYPQGYGKGWNDGRDEPSIPAQRERIDDLAFAEALIDDVAARHAVDAKHVFATGISNGAMFAQYLGAMRAARIAAIAPVAGGIPAAWVDRIQPTRPVSVLIVQGDADPIVPYAGGAITLPWGKSRGTIVGTDEAMQFWLRRDGCRAGPHIETLPDIDPGDGTHVVRQTYSGCEAGSAVELVRIEGGGHAWPGGRQYLPRRIVGTASRDLDATGLIWAFFKAHGRP